MHGQEGTQEMFSDGLQAPRVGGGGGAGRRLKRFKERESMKKLIRKWASHCSRCRLRESQVHGQEQKVRPLERPQCIQMPERDMSMSACSFGLVQPPSPLPIKKLNLEK